LPVEEPTAVNEFKLSVYNFESTTNWRTTPLRYE